MAYTLFTRNKFHRDNIVMDAEKGKKFHFSERITCGYRLCMGTI